METIAKIRRDYHVKRKGIKQIARERCVSRNTIRKVIREDEVEFRYERKKPRTSKLDAYRQDLEELFIQQRCAAGSSPRYGSADFSGVVSSGL